MRTAVRGEGTTIESTASVSLREKPSQSRKSALDGHSIDDRLMASTPPGVSLWMGIARGWPGNADAGSPHPPTRVTGIPCVEIVFRSTYRHDTAGRLSRVAMTRSCAPAGGTRCPSLSGRRSRCVSSLGFIPDSAGSCRRPAPADPGDRWGQSAATDRSAGWCWRRGAPRRVMPTIEIVRLQPVAPSPRGPLYACWSYAVRIIYQTDE